MRFQCPFCSYIITADESLLGTKSSCPSCTQSLIIPKEPRQEGCVIGDFILREKLGAGSLATVFKSVQISLGREVALKVLSNEYTDFKGVSDFLKEARAAAKLNHPNLVQAYAVGEESGVCYLAMDYVKGTTIKDLIQSEEEVPVDKALHIIQQVAEALYYAWEEAEMIHRDVKPDNIMINTEGMAKLTDLGLAMNKSDWHEDMDISGSPSYMSPEQFAGEVLDTRSDIYSLGVTLYQVLAKELPFDGSTIRTIAKQHFQEEAISLNKLNKNIPQSVANLVKKMIAKSPEDRFADMEELLKAIWQIRQKTAPSTEMIPNVHTISIKRLEYDIQNEKVEQRRREVEKERLVEAKIKKENRSIRVLFKIAIVALIALGGFLTFDFLSQGKQRKAYEEYSGLVANFEKMGDENAITKNFLTQYGEASKDLSFKVKMQNLEKEDELIVRIEKAYTTAQNKHYEQELKKLSSKKGGSRKQPQASHKALQNLVKEKETIKSEKDKKAKEVNKLKSELEKLETALKTEKAKKSKSMSQKNKELDRIKKVVLQDWKDELRYNVYSRLRARQFELALGFLQLENSKLLKQEASKRKWLESFTAWVENITSIYNELTGNGALRLLNVPSSTYAAQRNLLMGNYLEAASSQQADDEIKQVVRAILKNKLHLLEVLSFSDSDKALTEANKLLTKLESQKIFGDIVKSLNELIKKMQEI